MISVSAWYWYSFSISAFLFSYIAVSFLYILIKHFIALLSLAQPQCRERSHFTPPPRQRYHADDAFSLTFLARRHFDTTLFQYRASRQRVFAFYAWDMRHFHFTFSRTSYHIKATSGRRRSIFSLSLEAPAHDTYDITLLYISMLRGERRHHQCAIYNMPFLT